MLEPGAYEKRQEENKCSTDPILVSLAGDIRKDRIPNLTSREEFRAINVDDTEKY
jgi:hypothetical protein